MSIQKDLVVVIQGPIRINPKIIEKSWEGFNIIWSTWIGEKLETTNPVIYNTIPENRGVSNLNMQVVSTLNGLELAKSTGYKHALKWRSDQLPQNSHALMSSFNIDKMNVFYWCNCDGGYYTDYFMMGTIDDMVSVWNINNVNDYKFPEQAVTERLFNHSVNCIGDSITSTDEIYWYRNRQPILLSEYRHTGNFEVRNL